MQEQTPLMDINSVDFQPRNYPTRLVFLVNMAVVVVEGFVLWAVLSEVLRVQLFLLMHLTVVACLLVWHAWCRKQGWSHLFPSFTVMFVTCLGPLGALGCAYGVLAHTYFRRNAVPFEEWYAQLFPDEEQDRTKDLYDELIRMDAMFEAEERRVDPLLDVVHHGTFEQKQAAIVLMANKFIPAFAPLLKAAVNDANNAIRVLAATAISKVETFYVERAMDLQQRLEEDAAPVNHLALARHYDDHAHSGLMETIQQNTFQEKALEHYRAYLKIAPDDPGAVTAVGRLLVRLDKINEARGWFKQYESQAGQSPGFLNWYADVLFQKGDFSEVRRLVSAHGAQMVNADGTPPALGEAVRLWAGEAYW